MKLISEFTETDLECIVEAKENGEKNYVIEGVFAQADQKINLTDTTFKVFGACEMCKGRIEDALKLKGISKALWDVDAKLLSIQFDAKKISLDKIENTIVAVGHDLVNKKAKDYIYQDLPKCCLYRELETHHDDLPLENNNLSQISGVVVQEGNNGKFEPFMNASVYWAGTKTGVLTDSFGVFKLNINPIKKLVISYVGFKSDTITIGIPVKIPQKIIVPISTPNASATNNGPGVGGTNVCVTPNPIANAPAKTNKFLRVF